MTDPAAWRRSFPCEPGPATDPNAVSPPDPVYATCDGCGSSLEDARLATFDHCPVYLCWCGRWHYEDRATP